MPNISNNFFFLQCPDEHFYAVQIFPTEEKLQQEIKKIRGRACKQDKEVRALCLRYVAQKRDSLGEFETTKELGSIFFLEQDRYSIEVVVHELSHAAVGWANRIGLQPVAQARSKKPSDEERFAVCMQSLTRQYFQKCKQS